MKKCPLPVFLPLIAPQAAIKGQSEPETKSTAPRKRSGFCDFITEKETVSIYNENTKDI